MNSQQYESLVRELLCLSARTDGPCETWHQREAGTILSKICLTSLSSLWFIPGSSRFTGEVWDISTLATLSRSITESYSALRYIAVEKVTTDESTFRRLLWEFHREEESLRMLQATVPDSPGILQVTVRRDALKARVVANQVFLGLSEKFRRRLLKGEDTATKSRVDICRDAGINPDLYRGIYKYLSCFTHPSPFGLSALYHHKAGQAETLDLIDLITEWTSGFVAFSIRDFAEVFPGQKAQIPDGVWDEIRKWQTILTWDFHSLNNMIHGKVNSRPPPRPDAKPEAGLASGET
jgi:hypothetical protein